MSSHLPSLEGFTPFETVKEMARSMTVDAFVEAYPSPGLLGIEVSSTGQHGEEDISHSGIQLLTVVGMTAKSALFINHVAFLTKRPGNPFPHLISLGRSGNNDVVYAVDTVSKLHGYFSEEGGEWAFTDHRSTNGTTVNWEKLEAGEKRPVADGNRVQFGTEVAAVFLTPRSLYSRALLP